jgi:acyl-CoA synthetase (AMP-forming)/AMP-acid ligase II
LTHTLPDDPHPDWISTVGRPVPQSEIKIVSTETGAIVPVGEIGEICARGYSIMKDYFDNPEATIGNSIPKAGFTPAIWGVSTSTHNRNTASESTTPARRAEAIAASGRRRG